MLHRASVTGRSDDTEDVIRHRLELYHHETEPVASAYSQRGILLSVDGMGSEDEIFDRLLAALRASFPAAIPDATAGSYRGELTAKAASGFLRKRPWPVFFLVGLTGFEPATP